MRMLGQISGIQTPEFFLPMRGTLFWFNKSGILRVCVDLQLFYNVDLSHVPRSFVFPKVPQSLTLSVRCDSVV